PPLPAGRERPRARTSRAARRRGLGRRAAGRGQAIRTSAAFGAGEGESARADGANQPLGGFGWDDGALRQLCACRPTPSRLPPPSPQGGGETSRTAPSSPSPLRGGLG